MTETYFQNFLEKRNNDFIDMYTSESAIWLIDTLRGGKKKEDTKKCVLLSFNPPLASPPIVFNWNENDVWFMGSLKSEEKDFIKLEENLAKSEFPYVIFLERNIPAYKDKINSFIKEFCESRFKNEPLKELPKFFFAEYRSPMTRVKISLLQGEKS